MNSNSNNDSITILLLLWFICSYRKFCSFCCNRIRSKSGAKTKLIFFLSSKTKKLLKLNSLENTYTTSTKAHNFSTFKPFRYFFLLFFWFCLVIFLSEFVKFHRALEDVRCSHTNWLVARLATTGQVKAIQTANRYECDEYKNRRRRKKRREKNVF